MAMPGSGCIALLNCISGIVCSSISCAVTGNATPPKSLCALGIAAGFSLPINASCFYNYANFKCIGYTCIAGNGTIGSSQDVSRTMCVCRNPAMVAGECFNICFTTNMNTICQGASASAYYCVICNGSCVAGCCIAGNICAPNLNAGPFTVNCSTTMCVITCAHTTSTSCVLAACVNNCISSVSSVSGSFCRSGSGYFCNICTG